MRDSLRRALARGVAIGLATFLVVSVFATAPAEADKKRKPAPKGHAAKKAPPGAAAPARIPAALPPKTENDHWEQDTIANCAYSPDLCTAGMVCCRHLEFTNGTHSKYDFCADLKANTGACGGCGRACPSGLECVDGLCGCRADQRLCGGECTSVLIDDSNCGACGVDCGGVRTCTNGKCGGIKCEAGRSLCAGVGCMDLKTNEAHCGQCFHQCPGDFSCVRGSCRP